MSPADENVSAERGTRVAGIGASGMRDLGGDAVGDRAVGVRHLDLDAIGAGGLARRLRDVADAALAGLPGDQLHLGRVADLDAGDLALRHLDHRQHRIEPDDLRDLLAGEGEGRRADLRNLGDDAVPRRRDDAAVALGLGGGERGLGGLVLRFEIDQLEPRHGVGLDQPPLGLELDLALLEQRLGLRDLRLARLVRQDGDDVALLHVRAAANLATPEHAVGAREGHHLAVGLGAAGQHQLAAVRDDVGVDHRDAEQLLAAWSRRRGARPCSPRIRAECRWPDSIHSAAAATRPTAVMRLAFIGDFSSFTTAQRRAAAQHVTRDIHEHRNQRFGSEVRIERAPPPDAVGDDHQHVDRALDVGVLGDVAALGGGVEHVDQPFADVGIERSRDARDLRIAPRLGHHLGAELHLLDRADR